MGSAKKELACQALGPRYYMPREAFRQRLSTLRRGDVLKAIRPEAAREKRNKDMIDANETRLIGFVGADPEKRTTEKGLSFAALSVATKTAWKKAESDEWESRTEWHRVMVWGKLAERLNLHKGDRVLVLGEIRYRDYESDVSDGTNTVDVKKRVVEIHASGVERLYKAEKQEGVE
jgi:single-strand DNA-binding protein